MLRSSLDLTRIKPLDKTLWAGAVDNLGGDVLAWMASTMQQNGVIASIGLAASMSLNTTVAPFILRGASLLGIDSGYTAMPLRRKVWERLAGDMRPAHLASMTRTRQAVRAAAGIRRSFIKGQARGRVVVDCAAVTSHERSCRLRPAACPHRR
jgi:acrylyl-CoA reductase (NADPH)